MKRLVLVLSLCALVAVPAVAMASAFATTQEFQGRLGGGPRTADDPNTFVGFDITGKRPNRVVRHISVALPMACYNGDQQIVEVSTSDPIKVWDRRGADYFADGIDASSDHGSGRIRLEGFIERHGKVLGDVSVRTHSATYGKCYSGTLYFKAQRGAEVEYPPAP